MAASHDSAGFKLFTELYRKKRAKDGRRELPKKEFEAKTSAHWNALPTEKHKRYNDEAIRRLTRTPMKRRYICSTRCSSRKGNHTPRHSRRDYRSRSPLSYRTDDRSRSWSDSTARTEYLGDTTYYSDSSYTDTANTCYDDDDCSDATSCSSIASSYDDLTDPTLREPRPATSAKSCKPVRKAGKGKMASTSKVLRAKVTANKKLSAQKASRQRVSKKKAETKKAAATATAPNKARRRGKPAKKRAKVSRVHKPRPVATKKVVPLRRTRASRNVNVTDKREKATPPRQLEKELKTPAVEVNPPATEQQVNE